MLVIANQYYNFITQCYTVFITGFHRDNQLNIIYP